MFFSLLTRAEGGRVEPRKGRDSRQAGAAFGPGRNGSPGAERKKYRRSRANRAPAPAGAASEARSRQATTPPRDAERRAGLEAAFCREGSGKRRGREAPVPQARPGAERPALTWPALRPAGGAAHPSGTIGLRREVRASRPGRRDSLGGASEGRSRASGWQARTGAARRARQPASDHARLGV